MDLCGHLIDERLGALPADGFIDQRIRRRAEIARQCTGQIRVVAMRVGRAANGVLKDAHNRNRVDGFGKVCGATV